MTMNTLQRRRLIIVILCFSSSFMGLLVTFASLLSVFSSGSSHDYSFGYLGILMLFSWFVLATMCIRWVQNRNLKKIWPIMGTITGVICILFTGFPVNVIFVFPAIILAWYLVGWFLYQA